MKIGLLPLDERPVNTRYPAMIAAIAGAELLLPPVQLLSAQRHPANCPALADWMIDVAPKLDGLIVSVEMLGYGGLIASRTSNDSAAAVGARLERLRDMRAANPHLPIYGFNLVTRVSNVNDAVEEPTYWAEYGERLYAFSQLLDRKRQGQPVDAELADLMASIPAAQRRDLLARRLRNHAVNLATLGLLDEGVLDLLVLSSDDTSPFGLPSQEKQWLTNWATLFGMTGADSRLLMYPGADEVGCVLLARLLNERADTTPTVTASYAPPEAATNVAAYEDGPISLTVERHVAAAGGRLVNAGGSVWLGVNAPVARRAEWNAHDGAAERTSRLPALTALADEARSRIASGQAVAVADVAYPNGADPTLMAMLVERVELSALTAYGAWNTAGNTVGTVIAQSFVARLIDSAAGREAQQRFLWHRLIEDWGYQHVVRAAVREQRRATTGHHDPATPEAVAATVMQIEAGLQAFIARLPSSGAHYGIVPGSLRLPWGRTFEVDFELRPLERG